MNFNIIKLNPNLVDTSQLIVDYRLGQSNCLYKINETDLYIWNNKTANRDYLNMFPVTSINYLKLTKENYKSIFRYFAKRKQVIGISTGIEEELNDLKVFQHFESFFFKITNQIPLQSSEIKQTIFSFNMIMDNLINNLDNFTMIIRIPIYDWYVDFKLYANFYSYYVVDIITNLKHKRQPEINVRNSLHLLYAKLLQLTKNIPISRKTKFDIIKEKWTY